MSVYNSSEITVHKLNELRDENKKIQIDNSSCSIFFKNIIKIKNKITERYDPIYFLKSIKNKVEIHDVSRIISKKCNNILDEKRNKSVTVFSKISDWENHIKKILKKKKMFM